MKTIAIILMGHALIVATVFADEKANRVSRTVIPAVPGWVADTAPLTADRRAFPFVQTPQSFSSSRRAESPADGTWREEGGFVIINLGGRDFRLKKAATGPAARQRPATRVTLSARSTTESEPDLRRAPPDSGTVEGRLLNRRRPLSGCRVSLIPLRRTYFGYAINRDNEPQTTATDANGRYRFESVPPGRYKLYWLPAGHKRWIRRLEIKPDVVVRKNGTAHVKTIRVALQTIN
ncbi:MAG: collagen binding domain-containing protein [Planctomycetaceae bacterium]